MLLGKIKSKIDKHSIISFDIFDTLLLRPYAKPVDLFYHLEKLEKAPFFAENRIKAEKLAWARNTNNDKEDITYDEIYDYIDSEFLFLKQKEIELERKILLQNTEMHEVYDYAVNQGKKIIIISDMYLPKNFLEDVLIKNGYTNYDHLYVSNEIGKTKHTSNLYKKVRDDLNIPTEEMLHIGDNYYSDCEMAKTLGIEPIFYEKVFDTFLKENYKAKMFYDRHPNELGISIMLAVLSIRWQKQRTKQQDINYWQKLGYCYGGPACYSFMKFIEKDIIKKDIKDILFVARDGYTLEKVFNVLKNQEIRTHYVYAPRFLNLISRLDLDSPSKAVIQERTIALINYYEDRTKESQTILKDVNQKQVFIKDKIEVFSELSKKEMNNYRNYLCSFELNNDKIALVDTVTISFSSQQLLAEALEAKSLIGYYWCALTENDSYNGHDFKRFLDERIHLRDGSFVEFLMTAPEPPIQRVEGGLPVYKADLSEFEKHRIEIYPFVSEGAIGFAQDIRQIFGNYDIFISNKDILGWLNIYAENPEIEDKENMKNILQGVDMMHDEYVPIFPWWYDETLNKPSFFDLIFLGLSILKIKKDPYKIKVLFLNFIPLLKIKNKGNNKIIYLFGFLPLLKIERR